MRASSNVRNWANAGIARECLLSFHRRMRMLLVGTILASLLSAGGAATARQPAPASVCEVVRAAGKLIGKQVRVEGEVWDLGTHGFALTSRRPGCENGQLGLWTDHVDGSSIWRRAFSNSSGPKRAILIGIVRWGKPRFAAGRNPALTVTRVEHLSRREID
jgi:hypothetical protein